MLFDQIGTFLAWKNNLQHISSFTAPSKPLLRKFGILKLKDQISLLNCLFIHDQTRNLLPKSFNDFFIPCCDLYEINTRRPGSMFTKQVNTQKYGRQSIKISSCLMWNHLCEILDLNLLALNKFTLKTTLTNHFLSTYKD